MRNGAPFLGIPEPLQRLSRALLRREGGDRVLAKVLSAVPTHGLETVLVAVELVPRLREGPPPEKVETALGVTDPPTAEPERHVGLRSDAAQGDLQATEVSHD